MATTTATTTPQPQKKLDKAMGLFDVYAICTGAMFSSGFFLLPGLAAVQTGPSVFVAYMIAGIFMLPSMFSTAELSTAMPRAGGSYYFLDRAMGPLIGTIGGIGTYLALSLKSAFALIGMGAYVALFIEDVNIQIIAIVLTGVFTLLNIFGAKETSGLQRILVTVLIAIMAVFLVSGLISAVGLATSESGVRNQNVTFFSDGFGGLLATVGFVFVSYAGLTKIASVAEEVVNPGRNIPLGMILAITTTTIIYVIGVAIMVAVIPMSDFAASLTPVADTAGETMTWLPGEIGILLVVAAAVAAFASTGNAGILAASRYPLAMGRDRLIPKRFAALGSTGMPVFSIVVTAGLMIFAILALDESSIAKVASTFQLLIFMLLNASVIVMRESRIEFYDPIYKSPLYPWMQIFGILASVFLLTYIGADALLLTAIVIVLAVAWYFYYANQKVVRHGAIFHWFEQLGERRYEGLEHELRDILKEKGLRDEDPFEDVVTRAYFVDADPGATFDEIAEQVCYFISQRHPLLNAEVESCVIADHFRESLSSNYTITSHGAALPNVRLPEVNHTELAIVRSQSGIMVNQGEDTVELKALFFLVSPEDNPGQHLRILAELARQIDETDFNEDWVAAADEQEIKEILLHSERVLTLWLNPQHVKTAELIGKRLSQIEMPEDTLVALIRRHDEVIIPRGSTQLFDGDRITIIGSPDNVQLLFRRYVSDQKG